jgi:ABC-2 type transport system permease protein
MNKLKSVIRHEYFTIVTQPSFWVMLLAIPLLISGAIGLSYLSERSSSDRIEELAKDLKNVVVVDESDLINKDVVTSAELQMQPGSAKDKLREQVRIGEKEALIVYPVDLQESKTYQIYLSSNDFTKSSSVSSLADNLLSTSLFLPLGSAEIISLAQNGAQSTITTYDNGETTAGINEYIIPGLFVVLFYIIFAFSVGYMLSSVGEEKENRSMEMVLTYVYPRTLIIGKLLAVILVALTQVAFFGLLALISILVALQLGNSLSLPAGVDLTQLVFDPVSILFGLGFLSFGFLMFAGFMTATASIAPSVKEANSFSAVFFVGAFIPFYFVSMLITDPGNVVTKFLTFFPLTSPVVALVRNAIGNMSLFESSLALLVMAVFMIISLWIAVRAFSLGALEFSQRIQLSSIFKG